MNVILFLMILFILLFATGGVVKLLSEGDYISRKWEKKYAFLLACITILLGIWILLVFVLPGSCPFIIAFGYLGLGGVYIFYTLAQVKKLGAYKQKVEKNG